jgi:uncharacterized membrane protein YccC
MTAPSARDWMFSVKTFIASMLALYIALKMQLPRPYWAMATVYIVSNPFVGATTSKSLYRAFGTMLGAAAAVAMVPPLVDTPYLLSFAAALWMGVMLYLSISDRTAKSYVFLLAGYTLPLIAFPTLSDPGTIFDVAITRTEEILLGIVCATVVNSVLFPSKLAPVLAERTAAWFRDAAFYATEALTGRPLAPEVTASRQRMAMTINGLELLLSQLAYDGVRPDIVRSAMELRSRMTVLVPIISAVADPLRVSLSEPTESNEALAKVAKDIATWIEQTREHPTANPESDVRRIAQQLRREVAALEPDKQALQSWQNALLSSVLWRLKLLVELWEDCITLQHAISADETGSWTPRFTHWRLDAISPFFDRSIMLFSTGSAIASVFVACVLWIESGWTDGAAGVSLAAVSCCFFAALDDPAPMVLRFFMASSVSILVAGVYLFVVLPNLHEFPMLVIVFALPFIWVGTLMPTPRFGLVATIVALTTATFLSIQSVYAADFQVFVNNNLSGQAGLLFAYLWTRVTRPFGTELAVRRLIRSSWEDLAEAASPQSVDAKREMAARMLDRLMQLLPRLGSTEAAHHPAVASFRDLRAGLNALDLQVEKTKVAPSLRIDIERVLDGVRAHFLQCAARNARQTPSSELLRAIDEALRNTVRDALGEDRITSTHALVSMRLAIFPESAPPSSLTSAPGQAGQ